MRMIIHLERKMKQRKRVSAYSDLFFHLPVYMKLIWVHYFLYLAVALALLNQKTVWRVGDLDLLSKFIDFKSQPRSRYSLALDGIADITPSSEFALTLSQDERMLANAVSTSDRDITEKWPTLLSVLSKVCAVSHDYDDVVKALKKEDVNDPIIDYLRDITYN